MVLTAVVDGGARGHLEGIRSGVEAARSLPMKTLINFLTSIVAIRTDGEAGAILLREH